MNLSIQEVINNLDPLIQRKLRRASDRIVLHMEDARDGGSSYVKAEDVRKDIDAVACYLFNNLNRYGKPNFDKAIDSGSRSIEFTQLVEEIGFKPSKKKGTKEHVVPIKVLTTKLFDLGAEATTEQVVEIIYTNYKIAWITREEDARLSDTTATYGNLKTSMPAEYYDPNSPLYMDPFARYKAASIELEK